MVLKQKNYVSLVSCFSRYHFYVRSQGRFVTNCTEIDKFLARACNLYESKSRAVVLKLIGDKSSGKFTLAYSLYKKLFPNEEVLFLSFSQLINLGGIPKGKKLFLYCDMGEVNKTELDLYSDLLFSEGRLAFLVKSFSEDVLEDKKYVSDLKFELPSFLERASDHYLVLSYFLQKLSPELALSEEAFLFYANKGCFKNIFELKYTLLWSHYKAMSHSFSKVSLKNLKESLSFVREFKEEFLMMEKIDFSCLLELVKGVGYKKCLSFLEDILIEKIFLESKQSYTKSSSYAKLPITTIRSKRLKYLK